MAAGARDAADVLQALRTATAHEHEQVEAALDLMSPALDRARLSAVLTLLHGFWQVAEDGLDAWAEREPDDAADVDWARRRRSALFAADLRVLGAEPAGDDRPARAGIRRTHGARARARGRDHGAGREPR
jgi:heme oxygenase